LLFTPVSSKALRMKDIGNTQGEPDQYELILESLKGYAIFTVDRNGIVTTWNSGAERIFLFKPGEIIGRNGNILYTPEDIAAKVPEMELQTARREGKAVNERFHVKKERSRFWGSGLVYPLLNKEGEHTGYTKIMQNISEEEQAKTNLREEKLLADTMVSSFIEPLVILNPQLSVINATGSFLVFFDVEKTSILDKNVFDVLENRIDTRQLQTILEVTLKNNNFQTSFELQYAHPELGTRTLLVKPRRIYQPPNLLFSVEFADLTEDRTMMQEKDVFISIASHEIKTPIAVIKAYGQILDRESKQAKPIVKSAVQKINEQISYMNTLVNALLDTTKLTTGRLVLDPEVFNLHNLVKETVDGVRMTQSTHEIRLDQEVDSIVFADKVRTGTVLANLLSNAIKYSPGAKEVVVNMEIQDHAVRVSVTDFGIGIPENEQKSLFRRFGRTASVKKTRIPGTGLGLHLSSEIIKMQGGDIGFTTEAEKGSTFYFVLPLY
jgi:PAS domain S-box-containing protein